MITVDNELLVMLSAPLTVGCVIGAWTAFVLLFVRRVTLGAWRIPAWIPWIVAFSGAFGGLLVEARQLVAASSGEIAAHNEAIAILALVLSPIWILSAAEVTLGISIHYMVDEFLALWRLSPTVHEGLSRGVRAAYLVVAAMTLSFGLQITYGQGQQVAVAGGDLFSLIEARAALTPLLNAGGILLAITGMTFVMWGESRQLPGNETQSEKPAEAN